MSGFVFGSHEGPAYDFHGARIVIKASGDDTQGQLAVMESTYPPGLLVHPHVHAGEDEMFYLLASRRPSTDYGRHSTCPAHDSSCVMARAIRDS